MKWLGLVLPKYYFLDTIILKHFVEAGSKMEKETLIKIPKHALAHFPDVASQTPQSGIFPGAFYGQLLLKP